MLAISLMKEIFVARNAFAAYLIISDVRTSVTITGTSSGAYSSRITRSASGSAVPITTRSGLRKSATADPSRKNSGLLTTLTGWLAFA